MRVDGKVALVTGGASGLGGATVRELLGAGASVVAADIVGTDEIGALGERAAFVTADVTDPLQVQAVVDLAVDRFGALHVAVSCAGVASPGRVLGRGGPLPLERFADVVNCNLVGTFNVVRLAAAAMARNEPDDGECGVLVNTASVAAFEGQVGQAAYAASKAGVAGLTLPVARDLAEHLVRCAAIAPGIFDTPMLAGLPQPARTSLRDQVPHPRRLGRPGEFAALVRHIVENPMLNGTVVRLDGALRMAPR